MRHKPLLFLTLGIGCLNIIQPTMAQDDILFHIKNTFYDVSTLLETTLTYDNGQQKTFENIIPEKKHYETGSPTDLPAPQGQVKEISLTLMVYYSDPKMRLGATLIDNKKIVPSSSNLKAVEITINFCNMVYKVIYNQ